MKPQDHVRTRHDEWGKRALSLWLGPLGDVQVDARIAGESRRGDVLFTERRHGPAQRRRRLGVLGKLAHGIVLFEFFRNPVPVQELKSCAIKAAELEAQQLRAARRAKHTRSTVASAFLCVITPSMSADFAVQVETTLIAPERPGVYRLAPVWRTTLVVVNQLPEDPSTVWLRLLGRGEVQAAAVRELARMTRREPLRDATLELLIAWRQSLPPPDQQSEDERELAMNFEQIYERWEQKTLARGRREGLRVCRREGRAGGLAEAVLEVLDARGLRVTAAQRKLLLACTDPAQLSAWLRGAATTPSAAALLSTEPARRPRAK